MSKSINLSSVIDPIMLRYDTLLKSAGFDDISDLSMLEAENRLPPELKPIVKSMRDLISFYYMDARLALIDDYLEKSR